MQKFPDHNKLSSLQVVNKINSAPGQLIQLVLNFSKRCCSPLMSSWSCSFTIEKNNIDSYVHKGGGGQISSAPWIALFK